VLGSSEEFVGKWSARSTFVAERPRTGFPLLPFQPSHRNKFNVVGRELPLFHPSPLSLFSLRIGYSKPDLLGLLRVTFRVFDDPSHSRVNGKESGE
jgi:hypothetical protein